MHLKTKQIAFLGVLAALAVLFLILSGMIEPNTLVFLGLASLCVGIAISETGMKSGSIFYIVVVLLGILVAPVKLYCITYAAMGLYVVVSEWIMRLTEARFEGVRLRGMRMIFKGIAFNLIYVPILLLAPNLIYTGKISTWIYLILILAGQAVCILYDWIYANLMHYYQTNLRKKLNLD